MISTTIDTHISNSDALEMIRSDYEKHHVRWLELRSMKKYAKAEYHQGVMDGLRYAAKLLSTTKG